MAMPTFQVAFDRLKGLIGQYTNVIIGHFGTVRDRLNEHTDATGNVHDMQPSDIGLGNVPDWLPATTEQAQQAISNAAFMTPRRTDDYANEKIFNVIGDAFEAASDQL